MTPTEKLVAELREANGKRTWGEWKQDESYRKFVEHENGFLADTTTADDSHFIALAANSMERLLRIIEVQREALVEYEKCFKVISAQMKLRPEMFSEPWHRQMANILGDSTNALSKCDRIAEGRE